MPRGFVISGLGGWGSGGLREAWGLEDLWFRVVGISGSGIWGVMA